MREIIVALAKGRLGEKGYELLKKTGLECKSMEEDNRKLVFESEENRVKYILVKPSDVPIYVERGVADLGIVGKDTLLEKEADVYEMLDLRYGKCKFAIAAPVGYEDDPDKKLVVATKYIKVARKYYENQDRDIDIIELKGSIELGPLVGLSDVILDIVETGRTLVENNLEVINEIGDISARLIVNKVSFKFKNKRINDIIKKVREELPND